jgi:Ni/Co efflux regulator RcnB
MNKLLVGACALSLVAASTAMAQPRPYNEAWQGGGQQNQGRHQGWAQDRGQGHSWSRGQRMGYNDWNNATQVDYRSHNLRRPPRGYEWRESNGQYVLGALATGLIASAILNSGR